MCSKIPDQAISREEIIYFVNCTEKRKLIEEHIEIKIYYKEYSKNKLISGKILTEKKLISSYLI